MLTKKQITETSWLVTKDSSPFGYIRVEGERHILTTHDHLGVKQHEYDSYKNLEVEWGKIKTVVNKSKAKAEVNGFPSKHDKANPLVVEGAEDLPTYTAAGKAVFVAGFVAIKYVETKSWQVGNCVKLVTLQGNTYIGPFKSRLEAMHHVKEENRKANV